MFFNPSVLLIVLRPRAQFWSHKQSSPFIQKFTWLFPHNQLTCYFSPIHLTTLGKLCQNLISSLGTLPLIIPHGTEWSSISSFWSRKWRYGRVGTEIGSSTPLWLINIVGFEWAMTFIGEFLGADWGSLMCVDREEMWVIIIRSVICIPSKWYQLSSSRLNN